MNDPVLVSFPDPKTGDVQRVAGTVTDKPDRDGNFQVTMLSTTGADLDLRVPADRIDKVTALLPAESMRNVRDRIDLASLLARQSQGDTVSRMARQANDKRMLAES